MAIPSTFELQGIRINCTSMLTVNYTKAQINSAAQAIENLITNAAIAISSAIDNSNHAPDPDSGAKEENRS